MSRIGFNRIQNSPKPALANNTDCMLAFDSGKYVSFADALSHTLVFGTTGTGKTRSVAGPAIGAHILAGHGGLIIDAKGNLIDFVRSFAAKAGRSVEVLEYGTFPSAIPVNIISKMTPALFYDFCFDIMRSSYNGNSHNEDFHMKACSIARDCFEFLQFMQKRIPECEPTLPLILEMFCNPRKATEIFEIFANDMADKDSKEEQALIGLVRNSQFHVLSQTEKKLRNAGNTHHEQCSYYTQTIQAVLKSWLATPGIKEKFCANGYGSIDMDKHYLSGKIVVLRFGAGCGTVASRLARGVINSFYEVVYLLGLQSKRESFVCIDEFQEVADLSSGRFSDVNFISMAREFRTGLIAATQSAASLINRSVNREGVESFISNCNNKIMFFSDDLVTREIAKRYDPDVDLIDLQPGQAFTVQYDSASRQHHWGNETLNKSFNDFMAMEKSTCKEVIPTESNNPDLEEILQSVKAFLKEEKDNGKENNAMKSETTGYERTETQLPKSSMRRGTSFREEVEKEEPSILEQKFPEIFTTYPAISVPTGWMEYTEKALEMYRSLGFTTRIASIRLNGLNHLEAEGNRRGTEIRILNQLLKMTGNLCMECGETLKSTEKMPEPDTSDDDDLEWDDVRSTDSSEIYDSLGNEEQIGICEKCLDKHGLKEFFKTR